MMESRIGRTSRGGALANAVWDGQHRDHRAPLHMRNSTTVSAASWLSAAVSRVHGVR